jgi:hypothetical protein
MLREKLDTLIAETGPATVQGGKNSKAAADSLVQARGLNQRLSKAEDLRAAQARAKNRTGPSGSGGNINNNTRREVGKVMDRRRDWTPDERKALEGLVQGGKGDNALRLVGKLSPSGNGLMAALNVGAAAAKGPVGAIPGMVGMGAKYLADRATVGKVEKLVQLVAGGGQSGQAAKAELNQLAKQNPKIPLLTRQVAQRMLATGGLAASSALASTQAAAQEDQ